MLLTKFYCKNSLSDFQFYLCLILTAGSKLKDQTQINIFNTFLNWSGKNIKLLWGINPQVGFKTKVKILIGLKL